ncbi:MAG: hypothetical protein ACI814_004378 [Mariniblastus sp.]|jgi:hypothetical protein
MLKKRRLRFPLRFELLRREESNDFQQHSPASFVQEYKIGDQHILMLKENFVCADKLPTIAAKNRFDLITLMTRRQKSALVERNRKLQLMIHQQTNSHAWQEKPSDK